MNIPEEKVIERIEEFAKQATYADGDCHLDSNEAIGQDESNAILSSNASTRPSQSRPNRLGQGIIQDCLEFIFPSFCGLCQQRTDWERSRFGVCLDCFQSMPCPGNTCYRCSAPLPDAVGPQVDCLHCRKEKWSFHRAICLGVYRDALRTAVVLMKRPFYEHLSSGLGRALGERILCQADTQYDYVISTPQHWFRRITRRTNSAELLAESIGQVMQVPWKRTWLVRSRITKKQGLLGGEQRRSNVKNAFRLGSIAGRTPDLQGKTILLVDDILTSGSTANAMTAPLKKAGAKRVDIAALARSISTG